MTINTGNVFVISAPSGAGKSSLVRALQTKDPHITISISHTTRSKRSGENDGTDYYFVNKEVFKRMLANNEFLEHACVYGNYYGTHKDTIKKLKEIGFDIILEIDWQGAKQIKKLIPDAILIFIMPPDLTELEKRLRNRNTDDEATIERRLNEASLEISHAKDFDIVVINDNFANALDELYSIILTRRLKK